MGQTQLTEARSGSTPARRPHYRPPERVGIAEQLADPHDRRRSNVRISHDGLRSLADVPDRMAQAFDTFAPAELPALTKMLTVIAESLSALPGDQRPHSRETPGTSD